MKYKGKIPERTLRVFALAMALADALHDFKITPEYLMLAILVNNQDNPMREIFINHRIIAADFYTTLYGRNAVALRLSVQLAEHFDISKVYYRLSGISMQIFQKAVSLLPNRNMALLPEVLALTIMDDNRCVAARILANKADDIRMLKHDIQELCKELQEREDGADSGNKEKEEDYAASSDKQANGKEKDTLLDLEAVRKRIPTLLQFGKDMTKSAEQGKLDPVIGRQQELKRMIQILGRRMKNNPLLIGEPGVGKTAVVEALVQAVLKGDVPHDLQKRVVVSLDVASLLAGANYQGEYEERLKNCLTEASENKQVILFIDEIHTLLTGEGNRKDDSRIGNVLKPLLARGELQVIGATTSVEYRKFFSNDAALERRFMPVQVDEPSEEEAIEIIRGLKSRYEKYHDIEITDEAVKAAVKLSKRYLASRFLPDKAIDLIDEAGSRLKLSAKEAELASKKFDKLTNPKKELLSEQIAEMEAELENLDELKKEAALQENFERAASLRQQELQKREALSKLQQELNGKKPDSVLTAQDIAETLTDWTGIPINQLSEEENGRLRNLEAELHKRVVGQDEAVRALAKAVRRGRVGLNRAKKPIGSFMFLGTTGVGKTELAKALAEVLFGDANSLIRFDMSEYDSTMSATRLFGSAPGYVGYEEGGQLTEAVYKKPYSVVLLDEVEKAHPDIWNVFLQVFEDGRLTDGKGRTIDFSNTVIIMTSNIGANLLSGERKTAKIGFASVGTDESSYVDLGDTADYNGLTYDKAKELVLSELKHHFNPEFLNRLDNIIFFEKLDKGAMTEIAKIMLKGLQQNSSAIGYPLTYSAESLEALTRKGYDPHYGARPLRRLIDGKLQDLLVDKKLSENAPEKAFLLLDYSKDTDFTLTEISETEYRERQDKLQTTDDKEKQERDLLTTATTEGGSGKAAKTDVEKRGAKRAAAKATVEDSTAAPATKKPSKRTAKKDGAKQDNEVLDKVKKAETDSGDGKVKKSGKSSGKRAENSERA